MMFEFDMAFERQKERRRQREVDDRAAASAACSRRRADANSSHAREAFKAKRGQEIGPVCECCGWDARRFGIGFIAAVGLLHAHHVVPVSCGGSDDDENFVMCCPNCHSLAHCYGQIIRVDGSQRVWIGPENRDQLLAVIAFFATTPRNDFKSELEEEAQVVVAPSARGGTRTRKARRPGDFEATQRTDGTPGAHNELDDSESGSEDPDPSQVGPRSDRSGQDSATNPATSSSNTAWRR